MLKNCFRIFCISLILLFLSCAPRPAGKPSPEGRLLHSVLSGMKSYRQIDTTFAIVFEKPDREIKGDGALTISGDGDLSLRVYSLGFLALELSSKNGIVKSNPSLSRKRASILTEGLRECLFWWDISDFTVVDEGDSYRLENNNRIIWIDKSTILPSRQIVLFNDGTELNISYEKPSQEMGIWYQSAMRIELSRYAVTLTVKKITFNF